MDVGRPGVRTVLVDECAVHLLLVVQHEAVQHRVLARHRAGEGAAGIVRPKVELVGVGLAVRVGEQVRDDVLEPHARGEAEAAAAEVERAVLVEEVARGVRRAAVGAALHEQLDQREVVMHDGEVQADLVGLGLGLALGCARVTVRVSVRVRVKVRVRLFDTVAKCRQTSPWYG